VAKALGVTKSLLSLIENGKRQPTDRQIMVLAKMLCLPPDILSLDAGRLPNDVQSALAKQPAEAIAAIRRRTEEHAIVYASVPQNIPVPTTRDKIAEAIKGLPPQEQEVVKRMIEEALK
jgi:transcriptional regulator with XRE-family HTH domain